MILRADDGDHPVEVGVREQQPFEQVQPALDRLQAPGQPPPHRLLAEPQPLPQQVAQAQHPRPPVQGRWRSG